MSFRKLIESPVGKPGRTSINDAQLHITDELVKEFDAIVKKLGGKTVARQILGGFKPVSKEVQDDSAETVQEATNSKGIAHFAGKDYADYKHGNPNRAAKTANVLLDQLEDILNDLNKCANDAGEFLAPAFRNGLKEDIQIRVNQCIKK